MCISSFNLHIPHHTCEKRNTDIRLILYFPLCYALRTEIINFKRIEDPNLNWLASESDPQNSLPDFSLLVPENC